MKDPAEILRGLRAAGAGDKKGSLLDPEEERHRVFEYAVRLLSSKSRSVRQLREKLALKGGASEEVIDSVVSKLQEYGYLSDESYAYGYASFKASQNPVGRNRLRQMLASKKLDAATVSGAVEKVLEEVSEEELIDRAIEKRLRVSGPPRDLKARKRLFDFLARRGFPHDLIMRKMRAAGEVGDE